MVKVEVAVYDSEDPEGTRNTATVQLDQLKSPDHATRVVGKMFLDLLKAIAEE